MVEGDAQDPVKPAQPSDPLLGRTLNDRFRIVEPIGSGGMGKVYKAIQSPLDRVVALKVLNPNFPAEKDPNFKRRFLLEASMTSKLRHPNTVTVIDYGQTTDGIYYIAMEYLEGQTLSQLLKGGQGLPWTRAMQIGQQICRSLREAHNNGIVHRDLKPANVMLLAEEDHDLVKVLDFGLVKSFVDAPDGMTPEVTQQGTFLGSPQYMAPEQARNTSDPRSDVYSLGILLYQMMVGRPPFMGKDYLEVIFSHLKEAVPPFRQFRPDLDVPMEIEAVVQKCLLKDPAQRYQSMEEVLEAMRLAAAAVGALVMPERTSPGFRIPAGLGATPPPMRLGPTPPPLPSQTRPAPTPPPLSDQASTSAMPMEEISLFSLQKKKKAGPLPWVLGFFAFVGVGVGIAWMIQKSGAPPKPVTPVADSSTSKPPDQAQVTQGPKTAPGVPSVKFRVNSDPAGAHVYLGRKDMGVTPVQFEVPAGPDGSVTEELVFTLDGYYPLNVVAGGAGTVVLSQKLQKRPKETTRVIVRERPSDPVDVQTAPPLEPQKAPTTTQPPAVAQSNPPAPAQPQPAAVTPNTPAPQVVQAKAALPPPPAPKQPEVLPFGDGMTPPVKLEGKDIEYTREALTAKVEGVMLVKCTIDTAGAVKNCKVIKPVPMMEKPVLEALYSRKYSPVTYQGQPVSVEYVFTIRLVPPQH